ncbi:DDT domain-containing protein PTM [Lactuca sativa]|uniref:PHD-type domain-containing protein n=1 Tax=Lactuca sativa TaxID=4236 RepID=A0A9R1WRY6_LACSA|nr:DDT domain-containing protein PTM [Lactuca sativa]KAJ0228603.1 hypothetical protein LSAT_V11C100025020 [Lactuca sativa]
MEPEVVKRERRGRKRKRKDGQDADKTAKKTAGGAKPKVLVGRYVKKEFSGVGVFIGKIVSYDAGLYRVDYEDGDCEDLESGEVKGFIVEDKDMNAGFRKRIKVLDERILKKYAKEKAVQSEKVRNDNGRISNGVELANAEKDENSVRGGAFELSGAQTEVDNESSSEISDYDLSGNIVEVESPSTPPPPPPQLPPSTGNFGVSEEHVSFLLSVYSFLRSFSVCLFLSPFGLDEFVGALNSSVPNTLLDAIHVALIRALKSHVEILSSEGSELASKCLRSMDWSLLDSLTWPMFIVQYLTTMRYAEGQEWKEFYVNVLEKDYYTLSAGRKLIILQILCDGALDSAELRAEIDNREESEVGPDPDAVLAFTEPVKDTPIKRRGRPPKNPLPKDQEPVKDIPIPAPNSSVPKVTGSHVGADVDEDGNVDECRLCGMDGILVCCDGCPLAYHSRCIGIMKMFMPEGAWYCPECTMNKIGPNVTKLTSLRGAEIFGIDPYEQVFLGSCNHLLVMKASRSSGSHVRYYSPVDIQKVLHALTDADEYKALYLNICKGILEHWEIPESVFSLPETNGIDKELPNKTVDADISTPSTILPMESSNGVEDLTSKDVVAASACISENGNCNIKSEMTMTCEMTNAPLVTKEAPKLPFFGDGCLYKGSSFKPQAYQNVYIHGDFAASAAASLAILSSEEKLGSQPQPLSSHRKFMSANYSLQTKAFLLAAKRFFWPNYEKKLVEVPRERCGWCLSCQVSSSSKKGCLLNSALSNAIKGPSKVLSSIRHSKNTEGSLASIATYLMFMEESLCGLTIGPFLNGNFRKQWCKKVEEAATLGEIKAALLEFEKNTRSIAFSADWIKLVDDMGLEKQVNTSVKNVVGSSQKRPGRPGRKPAVIVPEVTDNDGKDASVDFSWWRGGMLSKHIFQKGILPQMMLKHAARLGGSGKLNGVQYADGVTVPKRSRQFVWRAGVEMCKTASQLALQVRYLDLHVRWSELVRPDQPIQEGKGPETEASAFRNACIVDKKASGNKISYGVVFENQKHLPSRVLKNVLEVEESGDNKDKYWFVEMRIPLYLIKEYEMEKGILPNSDNKHVITLKKKQLKSKSSGKNIFSFLLDKRDNPGKCLCTLCQLDVPFKIAARCSVCEGYCHEQCAIESSVQMEKHVEFLITCKRCYQEKYVNVKPQVQIQINGDSPTSPLLLQGQESQHSTTSIKVEKQNGFEIRQHHVPTISNQSAQKNHPTPSQPKTSKSGKKSSKNILPTQSVDQIQSSSKKPKNNNSSKKRSKVTGAKLTLGLIWRKKNPDETGIDFRLKNLLLKNNPNGHLLAPSCHLCNKPYDSSLMYIHCEGCSKWFHADAVELKESTILDLVGFKCCRCRRIRIPVCPYTDPETRRKLEAKKKPLFKKKTLESDSNSETNEEQVNEWELDANSNTPVFDLDEAVNFQEDNKSLYSFPVVDPVNDRNRNIPIPKLEPDVGPGIGPVPKKLPVRRHVKSERELENPGFELPTSYNVGNADPESSTPVVEWNVSTNGFEDDMMFDYGDLNYEDMEFEPQTYFSFNELLADDGGSGGGQPQPGPQGGDPVDSANPDEYQMEMGMGMGYDMKQEPMFSVDSGVDMMPCRVCSQADPCPDLYCQTCGLWIHQHCSPWVDDDSPWSPETGWKCGNCREWV